MVLDKTLKGIRGVRLDNRKVLRAPGSRTKHFERLFCRLINNMFGCNSVRYNLKSPPLDMSKFDLLFKIFITELKAFSTT